MAASIYDPIWEKLKSLPEKEAATKGVSITSNKRLHARIIKAVIKRKWLDVGFKLKIDPTRTTLEHKIDGLIVTFYLKYSLSVEDF